MVNKLSNFYRHNRFVNIYTLIFIIILVSFTSCNSLEKNTPPYIIDVQAHRGGMGLRPANTLEAMLHAVNLGVNTLELDIAVTRDGHIVMSHDLWLDYLNTIKPDGTEMKEDDPRVYIYHTDYSQISKYIIGAREMAEWPERICMPCKIPLVKEVIKHIENFTKEKGISPITYNVEIKCASDYGGGVEGRDWPMYNEFVDACVQVLKSLELGDRLIVQCFDVRALSYMHKKYPQLHLSYLIGGSEIEYNEKGEVDFDKLLSRIGFVPEYFSPQSAFVSSKTVAEAHRRGMKIVTWTVDIHEEMLRMIEAGVDGIISNYPDRLLETVRFYNPM